MVITYMYGRVAISGPWIHLVFLYKGLSYGHSIQLGIIVMSSSLLLLL